MTGYNNIITFDMGGTSCDVALVKDGAPGIASRGKIEGRDLAVPMMDINTVSAGGGTIARVDRFGELVVGPESAGAVPGPACYGRGGSAPTITDCNLVLGHLSADNFLGGQMALDATKAESAIADAIARPLGMSVTEAAAGVVRIIDVKMEEAIKAISTMRGHDLRDFMLLAFGGAGPVHAGRIARDLGMAGVIVPLYPGVFSAIGLLMSHVKHDYIQSKMSPMSDLRPHDVEAVFERLAAQAQVELRADGFADEQICVERSLDLRYAGQGYEVGIDYDADLKRLRHRFDEQHRSLFGHMAPDEPVEVVSYRVRGIGLVPQVEMPKFKPTGAPLTAAKRGIRRVHFDGESLDCPIYQRDRLDVGLAIRGPAILDQLDCTTVIYPDQVARVDDWKNLIVTQER
jgi:N-methylhydantoinase A